MKKFQSKTAQLTLGAVLLAVFIILHVIVPGQKMVQSLMMVLTFLPVTIYAMSCGTKKALVMAAAGAVLCAFLLPLEAYLSYAIPALIIGIVGGMSYGKRKRLTVILLISVLQLLQNVAEVLLYKYLAGVDFIETYYQMVAMVTEQIPESWLSIELFSTFLEDLLVCSVPCIAILGAGAKGIIGFLLVKLLNSRLTSVMGPEADSKYTEQTKFSGKGISIAYFCAICICAVTAALPFLGMMPYHFVCAAAAAMGILLAIIYTYYFYSIRVRSQEDHQKRLIFSFLLVVTLPLGIFLLPLLELFLLKKDAEAPTEESQT